MLIVREAIPYVTVMEELVTPLPGPSPQRPRGSTTFPGVPQVAGVLQVKGEVDVYLSVQRVSTPRTLTIVPAPGAPSK